MGKEYQNWLQDEASRCVLEEAGVEGLDEEYQDILETLVGIDPRSRVPEKTFRFGAKALAAFTGSAKNSYALVVKMRVVRDRHRFRVYA